MEITRRASRGAVLNQLSMLAETFLLFLFSIVAARGLGDEEYGTYSFIVSMSSLVVLFSTLGLNEAVNVFIPKLRDRERKASFVFKRLLLTRLVIGAAAGCLYYVFAGALATLFGSPSLAHYFRLSVLYIVASNLSSIFLTLFIARMQLAVVALARVAGAGSSLLAVYLLLRLGYGIEAMIIVSILVALGVLAVYVIKTLPFLSVHGERTPVSRLYRFGFTLWLAVILDYVLGKQIDIVLLQYFGIAASQIGFYNIAFSVYRFLCSFVLVGLGGIGLASICEVAEKYGLESTANAWSVLTKLAIAVVLPVLVFSEIHSREIITVLYSDQFLGAAILLQAAIPFFIPAQLAGAGTSVAVLYALGRERVVLYCMFASGVSNLVLDCLLIPDRIGPVRCAGLGAMGAIVATLGTGMVMHIVLFAVTRRLTGIRYPAAFSVKIVCGSLVAGALTWKTLAGGLPGLLLACLIFSCAYGILVMVMRPLSRYDAEVMSRVAPRFVEKLRRWNICIGNE